MLKKNNYTILIPCAGDGKRLKSDKPKVLFKINGKTLLEILIKKFSRFTAEYCFVVSPKNKEIIKKELQNYEIIFKLIVQNKPTGMADAIKACKRQIKTTHTIIIWGDQIGIKTRTIENMIKLSSKYKLVVATKRVFNPYIHFVRDSKNNVISVLQKREGDIMPKIGENDAGFFIFKTRELFSLFINKMNKVNIKGKITKENNFIPLIVIFIKKFKSYNFYNKIDKIETIGLNYKSDAKYFIKKR